MLFAGVGSKFVPVIVTVVPTCPEAGEKEVMAGGSTIVKLVALALVLPPTVTVTVPVVAPVGTEVVRVVEVLAVTVAVMPLNLTELLEGVMSKPVPVIVMIVPTEPEDGEKDATATLHWVGIVGMLTASIEK